MSRYNQITYQEAKTAYEALGKILILRAERKKAGKGAELDDKYVESCIATSRALLSFYCESKIKGGEER